MKPTSLFVFLFLAGQICRAQELTEINVRITTEAFSINSIVFTLNGLDLYISSTGDIFPLNTHDKRTDGQEAYTCDKYYDYFEADEKAGKIRSINGVAIDYYDKFSNKEKVGKIKSIGNTNIDYYDNFDNDQKTGKIKSIGNINIDYYDSYEREEKKGKMKSFGNYNIDYYDTFSWEEKKGKLSTIGPVKIDYYDRFSNNNKKGRIKSICGNTQAFYVTVVDFLGLSDISN
ncbi:MULTISPECIES: hypothetical protein [Niastella]|uniref:Uncharacterized protein n=1 Tax=Niastella soli TaxID=2821487 RepID=A0ABS3YXZ4_9BACT|nr:hypothetical protein [Niastella soli]MBO9202806.1 hypothetical protein [Niastella soli]